MEQLHDDKPNPLVALVAVFQDGARLRFGTNPPVQQEHVMIGVGQLLGRWGVEFDVMPEVDARRDAKATFYICPKCQRAAEVGVGPVPRGDVEILVTVSPDGSTQVAVHGVVGPGCTELTAGIEKALGMTTERELAPAYYEAAESESQEVGRGG